MTGLHFPWRHALLSLVLAAGAGIAAAKDVVLLNVSYDPTRELYQEFNAAFARHWQARRRAAMSRRTRSTSTILASRWSRAPAMTATASSFPRPLRT